MQQDQRDYFQQRAEVELALARRAGSPAAAAVHHALAEAYAERVNAGGSPPAAAPPKG